jgi:LuxR family transcriptional regulator, maltose regulon positive regulatory protein
MSTPILATKLYVPRSRARVVFRPRLIERLNEGATGKVTLISAPAGFGKSTLLGEWAARGHRPVAWLSLDEADNDPVRFLTYVIAALQTVTAGIGQSLSAALQSPQPPPIETILTSLLNEIAGLPAPFSLVLDDYHVIDAPPAANAVAFLLAHLPDQMRLVIATREDPPLPLARLRARGHLLELRAADLRFSLVEAADFLNQVMGLNLAAEEIAALEKRTEGWIAGLQMAALALQGTADRPENSAAFVRDFSGSHRFVLDYLVEEVLQRQPEDVQNFLLRTSILDRLCGPLCEAVLGRQTASPLSGQATLAYLERANLFIVPLDGERRWYRYHHLFADLLRQRLRQRAASSENDEAWRLDELHIRASTWFEHNGLDIEAFQHAAAADDVERAERLIDSPGISLHLRGAVSTILDWLASLPASVKNARPSLWWRHGALLLVVGHTTGVEEKLQAAEAALPDGEPDDPTRSLIGQIATARSVLALTRYDAAAMLAQSRRALENLPATSLVLRAHANWTMGFGYFVQGDRAAAGQAYTEAIALGQASGDIFATLLAIIGLGNVQETDNQLPLAAETYRRALQMAGDQPLQIIHDPHLGLARILYEWNDLETAEEHGRRSLDLARQYDKVIDRFIFCELFLARLKLAQGDVAGAAAIVAQAEESARQPNFAHRLAEVAAVQLLVHLRQGQVAAAADLAQTYPLPTGQARVYLAQGKPAAALAVLEPLRRQAETRDWHDERLKALALEAIAHHLHGDRDTAVQLLAEALALAEPAGFIRLFLDEGVAMEQLLSAAADQGIMPRYTGQLLAAFGAALPSSANLQGSISDRQLLLEPLSRRELEILQLIAQGLSNREIGERLFLALDTVKGHNRRIFGKLQVQRRTEAVARARELGLL